jgi:hypothetical protein
MFAIEKKAIISGKRKKKKGGKRKVKKQQQQQQQQKTNLRIFGDSKYGQKQAQYLWEARGPEKHLPVCKLCQMSVFRRGLLMAAAIHNSGGGKVHNKTNWIPA